MRHMLWSAAAAFATLTRKQIAALFALLGITFAFDNVVTALMAVIMTLAIDPRAGLAVLFLLACVVVAAG